MTLDRKIRFFYASLFVVGFSMMLWSAITDPNTIAFTAGLLLGGGTSAFTKKANL